MRDKKIREFKIFFQYFQFSLRLPVELCQAGIQRQIMFEFLICPLKSEKYRKQAQLSCITLQGISVVSGKERRKTNHAHLDEKRTKK